jgi:AraC family transcriptional regulator of arabinose operon
MDDRRKHLYFSRMVALDPSRGNDGWTFQLISVPLSRHAAEEQFADAPQWNSDLHLIHTLEGSGILHVGKDRYETTPGNVLAVPIFRHCRWEKTGATAWTMLNLHARIYEADGTPLHEASLLPISFRPTDLPSVHDRLMHWQRDWTSGETMRRNVAAAGIVSLVTGYMSQFGRQPTVTAVSDPKMQRLREQLQRQASRPFDAAELAGEAALSISQCNRRFRASYGLSPKAYWQRHRLALAQSILISTAQSIKEIAEALGFADIYYFSRWFTHHSNLSPTAFRRQHRVM